VGRRSGGWGRGRSGGAGSPSGVRGPRRTAALLVVLGGAALLLAACGSSSPSSSSSATSAPSSRPPATTASATLKVASSSYGRILVAPTGQVLYALTADSPGTAACTGSCLSIWPPLTTTGTPVAGAGVRASLLGTFKLASGTLQVTYSGHQLYRYAGDGSAGETKGEGLPFPAGAATPSGHWYVVSAAGGLVTAASGVAHSGTTTTTSGSTYSY